RAAGLLPGGAGLLSRAAGCRELLPGGAGCCGSAGCCEAAGCCREAAGCCREAPGCCREAAGCCREAPALLPEAGLLSRGARLLSRGALLRGAGCCRERRAAAREARAAVARRRAAVARRRAAAGRRRAAVARRRAAAGSAGCCREAAGCCREAPGCCCGGAGLLSRGGGLLPGGAAAAVARRRAAAERRRAAVARRGLLPLLPGDGEDGRLPRRLSTVSPELAIRSAKNCSGSPAASGLFAAEFFQEKRIEAAEAFLRIEQRLERFERLKPVADSDLCDDCPTRIHSLRNTQRKLWMSFKKAVNPASRHSRENWVRQRGELGQAAGQELGQAAGELVRQRENWVRQRENWSGSGELGQAAGELGQAAENWVRQRVLLLLSYYRKGKSRFEISLFSIKFIYKYSCLDMAQAAPAFLAGEIADSIRRHLQQQLSRNWKLLHGRLLYGVRKKAFFCLCILSRNGARHMRLPMVLTCGHNVCTECVLSSLRQKSDSWTCRVDGCQVATKYNQPLNKLNTIPVGVLPLDLNLIGMFYSDMLIRLTQKSDVRKSSGDEDRGEASKEFTVPGAGIARDRSACSACKAVQSSVKCAECNDSLFCHSCFREFHNQLGFSHQIEPAVTTQLLKPAEDPVCSSAVSHSSAVPANIFCVTCASLICSACQQSSEHADHSTCEFGQANMRLLRWLLSIADSLESLANRLVESEQTLLSETARLESETTSSLQSEVRADFSILYARLISAENDAVCRLRQSGVLAPLAQQSEQLLAELRRCADWLLPLSLSLKALRSAGSDAIARWCPVKPFDYARLLQLLSSLTNQPVCVLPPNVTAVSSAGASAAASMPQLCRRSDTQPFDLAHFSIASPARLQACPPASLEPGIEHLLANSPAGIFCDSGLLEQPSVQQESLSNPLPKAAVVAEEADSAAPTTMPVPLSTGDAVIPLFLLSPREIWVARYAEQAWLKRTQQLCSQAAKSQLAVQTETVQSGDWVLSRFQSASDWCRAIVTKLNIESAVCDVFFPDYGNSVSNKQIAELLTMPPALCEIPPLAHRISLNNIAPRVMNNGPTSQQQPDQWSTEAVYELQEILVKKCFTGDLIVRIVSQQPGETLVDLLIRVVLHDCDLRFLSVRELLVFANLACYAMPYLHNREASNDLVDTEAPRLFLRSSNIFKGYRFFGSVSAFYSPDEFYVFRCNQGADMDVFEEMQQALQFHNQLGFSHQIEPAVTTQLLKPAEDPVCSSAVSHSSAVPANIFCVTCASLICSACQQSSEHADHSTCEFGQANMRLLRWLLSIADSLESLANRLVESEQTLLSETARLESETTSSLQSEVRADFSILYARLISAENDAVCRLRQSGVLAPLAQQSEQLLAELRRCADWLLPLSLSLKALRSAAATPSLAGARLLQLLSSLTNQPVCVLPPNVTAVSSAGASAAASMPQLCRRSDTQPFDLAHFSIASPARLQACPPASLEPGIEHLLANSPAGIFCDSGLLEQPSVQQESLSNPLPKAAVVAEEADSAAPTTMPVPLSTGDAVIPLFLLSPREIWVARYAEQAWLKRKLNSCAARRPSLSWQYRLKLCNQAIGYSAGSRAPQTGAELLLLS
uniref:RING-type domain-containing protein n=1 Tax=Macrostomum lignano TaxID=282301 RepID=A0A1I8ITL0_9PLAT